MRELGAMRDEANRRAAMGGKVPRALGGKVPRALGGKAPRRGLGDDSEEEEEEEEEVVEAAAGRVDARVEAGVEGPCEPLQLERIRLTRLVSFSFFCNSVGTDPIDEVQN